MKKYARIKNNVILELINIDEDINHLYHPTAAAEFVEFNEDAEIGYTLIDNVWTAPKVLTEDEIKALIEEQAKNQESN